MTEASEPLTSYKTIEDVFTRALKSGQRPLEGGFVSPADGKLVLSQKIENATAIQAKGLFYSPAELIWGPTDSTDFESKLNHPLTWFLTVYLAPHNYHRVHSPVRGRVRSIRHIPGRLWPVNEPAVHSIPRLFCQNERLVFEFDTGQGFVWAVMVGAFNVGRMSTPLDPALITNELGRPKTIETRLLQELDVNAGQEIGTFMLGSTVVVILDQKACESFKPKFVDRNHVIRMGQSLSLS